MSETSYLQEKSLTTRKKILLQTDRSVNVHIKDNGWMFRQCALLLKRPLPVCWAVWGKWEDCCMLGVSAGRGEKGGRDGAGCGTAACTDKFIVIWVQRMYVLGWNEGNAAMLNTRLLLAYVVTQRDTFIQTHCCLGRDLKKDDTVWTLGTQSDYEWSTEKKLKK